MTDYVSVANAIQATLTADAWMGDPNNVRTIEVYKRGFQLQDEKDALFFSPADLPALAVVPNAAAKQQTLETTNEIRETVSAQVVAVTRHRDAQAGWTAHQAIVRNIERVLEAQKSSQADLGMDAFVRGVATTEEQFKKGAHYYFATTTTAEIELTASF